MFICDICGKILEKAGSHPAIHKLEGKLSWNKGGGYYSPEARANMSKGQKARFQRMDAPNKGIPHTEETKEKNRQAHLGKSHIVSQEARQKISEAHKGKPRPDVVLRNYIPEQRRKMLKGLIKRPTKPERTFISLCHQYNLPYKYVGNGDVIIGNKNPDFINVNGEKKVVEILGSYWHNEQETQDRIALYAQYGFQCIPIWEYKLRDTNLILSKLGEEAL